MPITADAQFEIRSTVLGAGSGSVWIDSNHVEGFGIPAPKSSDVDLWGAPGAAGNPEYDDVRVISIPIKIVASSAAGAITVLQTVWSAWASSPTNISLKVRLGGATFTVSGRPRGATNDDLSMIAQGIITLQLHFVALNPAVTVT